MSMEEHGVMSNARLLAVVRKAAQARLTDDQIEGSWRNASKQDLLRALARWQGPAAVVGAGFALWELAHHPVLDAVQRGASAREVMERWALLERFGHSRHRTRVAGEERCGESPMLTLEHVARDGGAIDPINDLFIWGLLARLLEKAGFEQVSASLGDAPDAQVIYRGGRAAPLDAICTPSARLVLRWRPGRRVPPELRPAAVELDTHSDARSLNRLFISDILKPWRLDDAARILHRSPRQLQRNLRAEATTFSDSMHRARLQVARDLMKDRRLSLTEIAFCSGFADLAHFSRLFCRYLDVPPSAFRELMMQERGGLPHQ